MTWPFTPGVFPFVEGREYTVDPETGCWTWALSLTHQGYAQCQRRRYKNATGTVYAHRQGYIAIHGPLSPTIHVHHRCENPVCINPAHLEATPANLHERHHRELASKLTHADVIAIREAAWNGERGMDLARQYGLTTTQIGFMCDGSKWKHVGGPIGKPPNPCRVCGVDMSHKVQSRKALYCSEKCKRRAGYLRAKSRRTATETKGSPDG